MCQSLVFDKVAGLRPATWLKKRDSVTGFFAVNFTGNLWTTASVLKKLIQTDSFKQAIVSALKRDKRFCVSKILHTWISTPSQ